ncbi:hypothetical protein BT63DRAFT_451367 [Microthyrium microscopicum]|uniref:Uncharacterized protein n=1 Tax=Microthyrium microscopicum TaxID=703497 RepID=A0A6A6UNH5_9PEZI|nr:hypothetical protein BT63DRAFT_451367 [Microthyrium microscopicum]
MRSSVFNRFRILRNGRNVTSPLDGSHARPRHASSTSKGSTNAQADSQRISRLQRLNSRFPPFLRSYTTPLLTAPISHVTSFLILHEITAIVPLVLLASAFHYSNWLPERIVEGEWVKAGVEKWGKYFRRKGWVEGNPEKPAVSTMKAGDVAKGAEMDVDAVKNKSGGWKVVVEVATAWAVVKAILPVRVVGSVWLTPWFARAAVIPLMRLFGRAMRK